MDILIFVWADQFVQNNEVVRDNWEVLSDVIAYFGHAHIDLQLWIFIHLKEQMMLYSLPKIIKWPRFLVNPYTILLRA
jgi:hypothetical protein